MNSKQNALLILMNAIDCKDENIAILYKYDYKYKNTIEIEPIENISNIIKDISDNYDENMINRKDKKSILSIVAFTDNADIEYQDLINGLKANILTE